MLYALFGSLLAVCAQTPVCGRVVDRSTGEPLAGAVVRSTAMPTRGVTTDADGRFTIGWLPTFGDSVEVRFVGYNTLRTRIADGAVYGLAERATAIAGVVVTATESRGLTASSVIGEHAMEHLQPSSMSDVLELLPGGMAHDPSLSAPNIIALREAGRPSGGYSTSSLGTSFVMDGAPISTNANMQFMNGAWDTQTTWRDFTNQGVDMRTLSTDDVQSIEVVRGIASVEYGDLTSGLVKIKRRRGGNDLRARFKADMSSKLFYVAKGTEWSRSGTTLNVSADWLDSKADPRNVLETYQRLTLSARAGRAWTSRRDWHHDAMLNVDYSGSFDDDKIDPELNYGGVDKYKSENNRYAVTLSLQGDRRGSGRGNSRFRIHNYEALASLSYEKSLLDRQRLVQVDHAQPAAVTRREGESQAVLIYPYTYTGRHRVDGRPLSAFAKVSATGSLPWRTVSNRLKAGVDWQIDKNLGDGQLFDPMQPLYPGLSARQRKYSDVPAEVSLSEYAEANLSLPAGRSTLQVDAGVRGSSMLGLEGDYALAGRYYLDPRVNVGWTLPSFRLGAHDATVRLAGGFGLHTKYPTIDQLYPELLYIDMVEMNYWHEEREKRAVWLQTYIEDPTNRRLRAARNRKWEASADADWDGGRLSVTWFVEDMTSGFRSMADYRPYIYKWYDTSGIDHTALTTAPDPATLPYEERHVLRSIGRTENGSRTLKKGVEYTYASRRWPVIMTRLTVTGAWFKTQYENSREVQEHVSRTVAGQNLELVGFYDDDDGYIRELWNTNFTFDTDVPRLALGFSVSAQCMWYTATQSMHQESVPTRWMDADGHVSPFTEADAAHLERQFLVRTHNESMEERQTAPFYMNINLKATKRLLRDRLMIALFVNKILDAHPDYVRNGYTIRRYVTPYFGLEVNLRVKN